ncbi:MULTISPECIES: dual specificity protein phosphatase family protein [unclassified Pseudoalteromonas]|uniref:phosphatase domain-containing putative toxin n=1 Tax=unclassified Pseudoalteromonas TaxID=194690 RepID=UPI0025B287B0|nr:MULTISPECIES: dual specificity protein phosphatase family protein [unclassified Pseudoalteromonas]MDN3380795.1 dual specificity protein phosphatase family protein [Pseudoalteromonas sp. APC 3893]MDN3389181.1 dual specificity protein phosphatase family protein [Pseudoalteromonas sp. APC 4017]
MQRHPYDTLILDNGAKLIFTPCPGSKEASLEESVITLQQAGTNIILTLMHDEELAKNNADQLPILCKLHNITWLQLPILDDAAPAQEFATQWQEHKSTIANAVKNQATIAVHCKGGSGRTGLVIALILLAHGMPTDEIIKQVQNIRPNALKNTHQLNYFNSQL